MVIHYQHNEVPRGFWGHNPLRPFLALWENRLLIWRLLRRDVAARYRGSVLGVSWAILSPLLVLATYEIVLSRLLFIRWEGIGERAGTLMVFAGLIVFNIFAETFSRAPGLIIENANYVKKVVFPLDALPWVCMLSALTSGGAAFLLLILFEVVMLGRLPWTVVLAPLALLPHLLTVMGGVWLLASLGVFLRDVRQLIGPMVTAAMFVTPVFFPLAAVPERLKALLVLNPMSGAVEQLRAVAIEGVLPSLSSWLILLAIGMASNWLGWLWFDKTKRGFADVL